MVVGDSYLNCFCRSSFHTVTIRQQVVLCVRTGKEHIRVASLGKLAQSWRRCSLNQVKGTIVAEGGGSAYLALC